jgi:hypothetical protein
MEINMKKTLLLLSLFLFSLPSFAGQFVQIKNVEVHYSAFNSTFLTPKVARAYQLKRSGYTALINISVLDISQAGKPAISAQVSGTAKNLLGQTKTLTFREIKEKNAIYYIAELPITNEETFRFDIDVSSGKKGAGKLKFNQKFYVEE